MPWKSYPNILPVSELERLVIREGLYAEITWVKNTTVIYRAVKEYNRNYSVDVWADGEHYTTRPITRKLCIEYAEIYLVKMCPLKELPLLIGSITNTHALKQLQARLKGDIPLKASFWPGEHSVWKGGTP